MKRLSLYNIYNLCFDIIIITLISIMNLYCTGAIIISMRIWNIQLIYSENTNIMLLEIEYNLCYTQLYEIRNKRLEKYNISLGTN